jgi:glutaredoxin 3
MGNIIIYTGKNCIYCDRAKDFFFRKDIQFEEIDLHTIDNVDELITNKFNGRKTVPQIFIGDFHVGGYDDLMALDKTGELENLLS